MRINISMTQEFYEKIKKASSEQGVSTSEYIRFVLSVYWSREECGREQHKIGESAKTGVP